MRQGNNEQIALESRARFAPYPHVVAASHGGAMVLLDTEREQYFSLTGAGGLIWAWLEEKPSFAELVNRLAEHYKAEPDRIATDASSFLTTLATHRLIHISEDGRKLE